MFPTTRYAPLSRIPRVYLIAGMLVPFFRDNPTRWAVALRERVASHGQALWRGEFPLMAAWVLDDETMPKAHATLAIWA